MVMQPGAMQAGTGISRGGLAAGLAAALALGVALWTTPTPASDALPGGAEPQVAAVPDPGAPARSEEFERWRGRSCPLGGCKAAPRGQASSTLAFGAAVGGIAWLSRRRGNHAS